MLPFLQRLAGDSAGARLTAEQARDTLEQLCKISPQFGSYGPTCLKLMLRWERRIQP